MPDDDGLLPCPPQERVMVIVRTKGVKPVTGRSDLTVRDSEGRPVVAVEVKNRRELTPDVAITLRRNIIAHGLLPSASYFMVLSQDVGYLWADNDRPVSDWYAPPTLQFPVAPVVRRYMPAIGAEDRLDEVQLQLLVLQWLTDLSSLAQPTESEPERLLASTRFLEDLRGTDVSVEVAA
jgi:hypothetical protein